MDKTDQIRILSKASGLGIVAALIALGSSGPLSAAGAFAGAVMAGIYAAGYFRSHLAAADRTKVFDPTVARGAGLRMALMAGGALACYFAGRSVLVSYTAAFGAVFAILVLTEIPRVRRALSQKSIAVSGKAERN